MASSSSSSAAAASSYSWAVDTIWKDGSHYMVDWSNKGLSDNDLQDYCDNRLKSHLDALPSNKSATECIIDISSNCLSAPQPLASLLELIREAPLHLTVLKLHKNQLIDPVCAVLVHHMMEAAKKQRPVMQLHLSNNSFSRNGLRVLIEGAHNSNSYPTPPGRKWQSMFGQDSYRRCLWLRCEHQFPPILDSGKVIEECEYNGCPVVIVDKGESIPPGAVVQMHWAVLDQAGPGEKGKSKSKGKGNSWEGKGSGKNGFDSGKGKGDGKHGFDSGKGKGDGKGDGKNGFDSGKGKGDGKNGFGFDSGKGKGDGKADFESGKGKGGKTGKDSGKGASEKGGGKDGGKMQESEGGGKGSAGKHFKNTMCSFFLRGACTKGPNCTFAHSQSELASNNEGAGKPQKEFVAKNFKRDMCKYFLEGKCGLGKECTFAHSWKEIEERKAVPPQEPKPLGATQTKAIPCKYHSMNQCKKGADCPFSHEGFPERIPGEKAAQAWLKAHREQGGSEGEMFEKEWKDWCRAKELSSVSKLERIASIIEFREVWCRNNQVGTDDLPGGDLAVPAYSSEEDGEEDAALEAACSTSPSAPAAAAAAAAPSSPSFQDKSASPTAATNANNGAGTASAAAAARSGAAAWLGMLKEEEAVAEKKEEEEEKQEEKAEKEEPAQKNGAEASAAAATEDDEMKKAMMRLLGAAS